MSGAKILIILLILYMFLFVLITTVSSDHLNKGDLCVEKSFDTYIISIKRTRDLLIVLRFNNSVTGGEVMVLFGVCGGGICGLGIYTDAGSAEYYSAGLVKDLNMSMRSFVGEKLFMCTETGFYLEIYYLNFYLMSYRYFLKSGCVMIYVR